MTKTKSQSTTDEAALARKISEIPITDIEVAAIKSDGLNPNQMSEEQFGGLVRHIQDNGILNPIIVTESMVLADGEHRVKAAKKLGMQTVPGRIIPDDDRLRRILRQTMNKIRGKHDQALDAAEFEVLIDSDGINDLAAYLGEDAGDLLKILDKATKKESLDDYDVDAAVEEIQQPITHTGDIYVMGNHRLICGDSTDPEVWDKLLSGERPEMMITDPPYNVDYTGATADKLKIQNDKMNEHDFYSFLLNFCKIAMERINGAQYIFMACAEWPTIHRAFIDAGGHRGGTIVWVKQHFTLGHSDYQNMHEPIYLGQSIKSMAGKKSSGQPIIYGWKRGGQRLHYDNRTESDIWITPKPNRSEIHPTMKPVTLYRKAILFSSRPTDIIFDGFSGSGTAFIAAEQTHRRCRGIELDPKYCDVIVKRWEEFTGRKAERIPADADAEEPDGCHN